MAFPFPLRRSFAVMKNAVWSQPWLATIMVFAVRWRGGEAEENLNVRSRRAVMKRYTLMNEKGEFYQSVVPGTFGGHRKRKVYGRLDCPSALRWIAKGHYRQHRVFFANEAIAKAVGYRPCGVCMREAYRIWKGTA